jgi:DNA-binding transcriptional LysR family regulator
VEGEVLHIEALKVFCDLVETQAITLAAERNFVTPSAIRQQIRSLESKFTKKLLDRQNGRHELSVTPTGQAFYRQCKRVLAGFDELQNEMSGPAGSISARVKVAADYCVGLYDLPPKLGEFMKRFPTARIDLEYCRSAQIVRDVLDGAADLGIVAFPEQHNGLNCVPIDGGKMVLICSPEHEFASRRRIIVEELSEHDLILFERGMPTRKSTDRIFRSHGVRIGKTIEFSNIETIKNAAEVGLGVAIVPHRSVLDEERNNRLVVVSIEGSEWERPVGVIFPTGSLLPYAAKKFVQVLENQERSH